MRLFFILQVLFSFPFHYLCPPINIHPFMKKLFFSFAFGLAAAAGFAVTPLWMRDVRISPDGTEIVFCYKGDIYKVAAKGGQPFN